MTDARGIIAAAALAAIVTGAHAGYRAWPVTHGTEIYVAAALVRAEGASRLVAVDLPFRRIEIDVPHTAPPPGLPFMKLPHVGDWWVSGGAHGNSRRLTGRALYVQLARDQPLWPGGPPVMRAVSVSDAPVDGALNVEGTVSRVRDDGFVWLDFGFGPITATLANTGVAAILRVMPSGHAALTGVMVNGTRY